MAVKDQVVGAEEVGGRGLFLDGAAIHPVEIFQVVSANRYYIQGIGTWRDKGEVGVVCRQLDIVYVAFTDRVVPGHQAGG